MNAASPPHAAAPRWADFRDPFVWSIALLVGAIHLAVAGRYDFFRNELYFIACGRHPAFGYADQPPLVPLLAAATQIFGENLVLLRLPSVVAAAALVPITAAIATLLGAGRAGAMMAAIAVAAAPGLTAITSTFGTSSLEPVGWALCAYFVLRAAMRAEPAALVWAGVAAGITFETKYGVAIWAAGLCAGLLLSPQRALLRTRGAALGAVLAAAIGAPSIIWQALHGWPFLDIVAWHSAEGRYFTGTFPVFVIKQVLAMNILVAPLWLAGLIAPWCIRDLRAARILGAACVITTAAIFAAHGKDYYLFPAYPALIGAGAAAAARLTKWLTIPWLALAAANAAFIAPITLPILSPAGLRRFMADTGISPAPSEAAAIGAKITQVFSDEFGWRDLATKVAAIYGALPPAERAQTGIFAWNYGEASAIGFFAAGQGLPPPMSAEAQYFLWGPRGAPTSLIIVNGDEDFWRHRCASLEPAGRFGAEYAMPYETDRPIELCRDLKQPLAEIWPALKTKR